MSCWRTVSSCSPIVAIQIEVPLALLAVMFPPIVTEPPDTLLDDVFVPAYIEPDAANAPQVIICPCTSIDTLVAKVAMT